MERRAREDEDMNKYERTPIGEGKQEQVCVVLVCCCQVYWLKIVPTAGI